MDKVFYQIVVYYDNLPQYHGSIIHHTKRLAQRHYDDNKAVINGAVGKNPKMRIIEIDLDERDYYTGIYPHFWLWIFPVEVDYIIPPEGWRVDIQDIYINGGGWIDELSLVEYDRVIEWCRQDDKEKS
jgi:hypothetical protein